MAADFGSGRVGIGNLCGVVHPGTQHTKNDGGIVGQTVPRSGIRDASGGNSVDDGQSADIEMVLDGAPDRVCHRRCLCPDRRVPPVVGTGTGCVNIGYGGGLGGMYRRNDRGALDSEIIIK